MLNRQVRTTYQNGSRLLKSRSATSLDEQNRRMGVIILEAILVTTLLVILTLAILQWSILMITHQGVTAAASEGARTASHSVFISTRQVETETTVATVLAAHGVSSVGMTVSIVDQGTYFTVQVTVPFTSTSIPELLDSFGMPMASRTLQVTAVGWKT